MKLTRREALATLGLGTVVTAIHPLAAQGGAAQPPAGPHSLPPLPYPAAALEPHIDAQTMTIHHGRHHQTYVTGLNTALAKDPAGRHPDRRGGRMRGRVSGGNFCRVSRQLICNSTVRWTWPA